MIENILQELVDKRNRLNNLVDDHKRKRDKYNQSAKRWARDRTENNDKTKNNIINANTHKIKRDDINSKVQEAKKERDLLNREYNKMADEVNKIKQERLPKEGISLNRLKHDHKKMEFKQMTSVLSPDKERELIDSLGQIQEQINAREKELEMNDEIRDAIQKAMKAKDQAEQVHKRVNELAEIAQTEHDQMVGLYKDANNSRRSADDAQNKFIETKELADIEHNNHIFYIRQVHDYDKVIAGLKLKFRKAKKEKTESIVKQQAEEIYERFKKGEKLSTEDLMCLQKAGYL